MDAFFKENIGHFISEHLNQPISKLKFEPISGGSINDCYRVWVSDNLNLFCKINAADRLPGLFEKERNGLEFLREQHAIRVPAVIECGLVADKQVLVLEWIEPAPKAGSFWTNFGEQLAQLHRTTHDSFGYFENNYMGAVPQENKSSNDWSSFFVTNRLAPMVRMAKDHGLLDDAQVQSFDPLLKRIPGIFSPDRPALLHGDLWSGNFLATSTDQPVLIDPAVYFGHRSMDLAMTRLFGGFDKKFYESYHYHFPLHKNHLEEWEICNLYPLLIHLNLFGSSYLPGIVGILKKYN